MLKRCNRKTCTTFCKWCVLAWAGLPLEHGMWEWTRLERLLPLIGLHV
jgi:hypothetical protein